MKKKIVTERDIDEAVRQMQMENGGMDGREHDDLENEGISRQHIRRVLERKFEKDCFHSPSAVALRAKNQNQTKSSANLRSRPFPLATSRKRVFAFEDLLNKTHEQLKAKDIGGLFYSRDEIEDCMRTLAKTCSEWCTIERAQDGEELFRVLVVSSSTRTEFLPRSSSIRRRAPSTPAPSATTTKNDRCSTPRGGGGGGESPSTKRPQIRLFAGRAEGQTKAPPRSRRVSSRTIISTISTISTRYVVGAREYNNKNTLTIMYVRTSPSSSSSSFCF